MHIRVDLLDHLPGNVHLLSSHTLCSQILVCEICKDIGAMLSKSDQVSLIDPCVELHFVESDASLWILVQHTQDQFLESLRYLPLTEAQLVLSDNAEEFSFIFVVEGECVVGEGIKCDAQGPDIGRAS